MEIGLNMDRFYTFGYVFLQCVSTRPTGNSKHTTEIKTEKGDALKPPFCWLCVGCACDRTNGRDKGMMKCTGEPVGRRLLFVGLCLPPLPFFFLLRCVVAQKTNKMEDETHLFFPE